MEEGPIRVLLVDDDQGDFEMIRAMISKIQLGEMGLDWVSTYREGLDALEEGAHDVYLIDYFLEDRTGMDLLREARKRSIQQPLIMLTGRGNRQVDVQAMEAGAADYLVKGRIDPKLLERSIRFALERTRTERALEESEERHRRMFAHLPVGLYRCSPDGAFMDANPALIHLLGYPDRETLEEVYASRFYVSPDHRDRFWELLETYGVARGFESWLEGSDGRPIRIRNTARIHQMRDGSIAYVEGAVEDITDLHRGREMEDGDAGFRILFEESATAVALLDREGAILEVNPAFHRRFGYPPEAVVGKSLLNLVPDGDADGLAATVRALSRGQKPRDVSDHRLLARDRNVHRVRTRAHAVGKEGRGRLLVLLEQLPGGDESP